MPDVPQVERFGLAVEELAADDRGEVKVRPGQHHADLPHRLDVEALSPDLAKVDLTDIVHTGDGVEKRICLLTPDGGEVQLARGIVHPLPVGQRHGVEDLHLRVGVGPGRDLFIAFASAQIRALELCEIGEL